MTRYVPLVLGLLGLTFAGACAGEEPDTIADVLEYLQAEYGEPLRRVASAAPCRYVDPASGQADCATLVAEIEDKNPVLERAIVRMDDIAEDRGGPLTQGGVLAKDAADILRDVDHADELLVDAWMDEDLAEWQEACALHDSASDKWQNYVERVLRLAQDSVTPNE